MLRTIRLTLAIVFFALVTLLFLDFTGTLHGWMGWMAKIQFLPALLALNAGVVLLLVALTLLFGRVYCSVICPLGVFPGLQASGRKTVSAILPPGNGCATQCWQCLPWPSLRACAFMQSPHCSNRTALTDASLPISSLPSISGAITCWHTWRNGRTATLSMKQRCG